VTYRGLRVEAIDNWSLKICYPKVNVALKELVETGGWLRFKQGEGELDPYETSVEKENLLSMNLPSRREPPLPVPLLHRCVEERVKPKLHSK